MTQFKLINRRPRDPMTAQPPRWVRDLARAVAETDPQRRARLILEGARACGVRVVGFADQVWPAGPKQARQRWERLIATNAAELAILVRAERADAARWHVLRALAHGARLRRTDFGTWMLIDRHMPSDARQLWRAARERHADLLPEVLAMVAAEVAAEGADEQKPDF